MVQLQTDILSLTLQAKKQTNMSQDFCTSSSIALKSMGFMREIMNVEILKFVLRHKLSR